jgi:hypothetical protein
MVIKAISEPNIYIKNQEAAKQDVIETERTESTLTPPFYGVCDIADENKEFVDTYKFDLYDSNDELVETSGWL